ncbi:MAG: histidine--tRNA ligase [Alphaproteobacteria bacterium]|nr:histidine--tRNA ligase [Alphaproteobacteria bacterium SS10]
MSKRAIYRPRPISGFPEWLPEQRLVEQRWMDHIRRVFESYGFASIETPSVEELDVLVAKGEVDKEIYTIQRLHAEEADKSEARLALHFDVTVPFARYVAQHFNALDFPFKRYQMQKVWRGERPQDGRFREFYQCDIDVINVDHLPLHFDAEIPAVALECVSGLGIGPVRMHVSNRKILDGYLSGLGIEDRVPVIRTLDRFDKIGAEGVVKALVSEVGLDQATAEKSLALAEIQTPDSSFADRVLALGVEHEMLSEGVEELRFVMDHLANEVPNADVLADLSIARGFDYYTGTVYEGRFIDKPGFGSIIAGGRYDDLAGSYINRKLPGVGISIGLTRIFGKMVADGLLETGAKCPTQVLVVLPSEERRGNAAAIAKQLRDRGLRVEMFHSPSKIARQLAYASKKGIGYVWFPPFDDNQPHEVKDMASGDQGAADPAVWTPAGQ